MPPYMYKNCDLPTDADKHAEMAKRRMKKTVEAPKLDSLKKTIQKEKPTNDSIGQNRDNRSQEKRCDNTSYYTCRQNVSGSEKTMGAKKAIVNQGQHKRNEQRKEMEKNNCETTLYDKCREVVNPKRNILRVEVERVGNKTVNEKLTTDQTKRFYEAQVYGDMDMIVHGLGWRDYRTEAKAQSDKKKDEFADLSDGEKDILESVERKKKVIKDHNKRIDQILEREALKKKIMKEFELFKQLETKHKEKKTSLKDLMRNRVNRMGRRVFGLQKNEDNVVCESAKTQECSKDKLTMEEKAEEKIKIGTRKVVDSLNCETKNRENDENKKSVFNSIKKKVINKKTQFLKLFGGAKRTSQTARDTMNDIPEVLQVADFNNITEEDILSVRNMEYMTNNALFRILHRMVEMHNDANKKNVVALTHLAFVDAVREQASGEIDHVDPQTFQSFLSENQNEKMLIPALIDHHFILLEVNLNEDKREINVYDSMFNGERLISREFVYNIANSLGMGCFDTVEVSYANRNEIKAQQDNFNCGLHVLQNVRAILNSRLTSGKNLMRSYSSDTDLAIHDQRSKFAKLLLNLTSNQLKKIRIENVDENRPSEGAIEDVMDTSDSQLMDTSDLRVMDTSDYDDWILLDKSDTLTSQLEASSWKGKRCLGLIKIRTKYETEKRDEKFVITSKCHGPICSLEELMELTEDNTDSSQATKIGDLVVNRLIGKFNIDLEREKKVSGWKNIGVCGNHMYELGYEYFSGKSKVFNHVFVSSSQKKKTLLCGWPESGVKPHTGKRSLAKCFISCEESNAVVQKVGLHLPAGLPVCRIHKEIAENISMQSLRNETPRILPAKTVYSKSQERIRTLTNSQINTSIPSQVKKPAMKNLKKKLMEYSKQALTAIDEDVSKDEQEDMTIANIEKLVNGEFRKIVKCLKNNLTADIRRLEGETEDCYSMRLLGRMNFHLCEKGVRTAQDVNICEVFPKLYENFMGADEKKKNKAESDDTLGSVDTESICSSDGSVSIHSNESNEGEPIDQFVPGEVQIKVKSTDLVKMDGDVEKELEDNIVDIVGREISDAQQNTKDVSKKITFVRLCTSDCIRPKNGEASLVLHKFLQFCDLNNQTLQCQLMEKCFEEIDKSLGTSVTDWIKKHENCYQGLRSLSKRLKELKRLRIGKLRIMSTKKGAQGGEDLVREMDWPDHLRMEYNRLYASKKCWKHHTQGAVMKKYGHLKAQFDNVMENTEDAICEICSQYTVRSRIAKKKRSVITNKFLLSKLKAAEEYDVCVMCWKEMREGRLPHGAVANGMESDEVPPVIKCLNNIEHMLIQRYRAVQNIFHLRDIGGRKTAMKGTKGVLALVPVAIESTVEHVAEVLPSAAHMIIHVSTPWEKVYVVSMQKVVEALHWLKKNNEEYADIKIDERFKFELGKNIIFDKPNATDADVEQLILRGKNTDDHLLTQANFEVQPMKEVIPVAKDDLLAIEKFALKKDKFRRLSIDEEKVDVKVLPALHPKGRYGMSDKRNRDVKTSKYVRHRILEKNRKYARNANWYSLMFALKSQKAMTSTLGIQARIRKGASTKEVRLEDPAFTTGMSSITEKIRGSPAYWQRCRKDLRAHVATFGNPTFFLTLNSNELEWTSGTEQRNADGEIVVLLKKAKTTKKRKIRTYVDKNEATIEELVGALPTLMETSEFELDEKRTIHSLLLCFVMMTDIRRGLIGMKDDEDINLEQLTLGNLMEGGTQCVEYLMRNIGSDLANPSSVFQNCFQYLAENLKKLVQITTTQKDKCSKCHFEDVTTIVKPIIEISETKGNLEDIVDEPYDGRYKIKKECKKCNLKNVMSRENILEENDQMKYAVIVNDGRRSEYSRLRQDGSFFLNRRWNLIASVHNVGTEIQECCLASPEGGFLVFGDNQWEEAPRKVSLNNVNVLVFKIKPYERTKKTIVETKIVEEVPEVYPDVEEESYDNDSKVSMESFEDTADYSPRRQLKLVNNGTDCFLITALNILNSMQQLRTEITASNQEGSIICSMRDIMNFSTDEVTLLRSLLPERLHQGEHDVDETLCYLLKGLPKSLLTSFSATRVIETRCTFGCEIVRREQDRAIIYWRGSKDGGKSVIGSIEQEKRSHKKCDSCEGEAIETVSHFVKDCVQNLLVSKAIGGPDCTERFAYPEVDTIVSLFGRNWRIKAMAEYRNNKNKKFGMSGHWVTWCDEGKEWFELDDDNWYSYTGTPDINFALCFIYNLEAI